MAQLDDLANLTTPEATLRELRKAKEFWRSIQTLPLVETAEKGIDWDAVEVKIEATGLKLPFVYPRSEREADAQRVMTMEAAMQILQTWETQMVRSLVISPTKIGLGLIGGTAKGIATGASVVVAIIASLANSSASYWQSALEVIKDSLAPLLLGSQFKVIKKLFKGRPDPATKALPQSTGKRFRKKARTRIGHEIRAARK